MMDEVEKAIGKLIDTISIHDDELTISFMDGASIKFSDTQSCCESRHVSSDDLAGVAYYRGVAFTGVEVRNGPEVADDNDYGVHETQFFIVKTFLGDLTFVNHNEHNGYYGGFSISAVFAG